MGQGLYSALVFGVIDRTGNLPWDEDEGEYPEWFQKLADPYGYPKDGIKYKSSYEAEPGYFGIILAVSDGFLSGHWKVPELDTRFAIAVRDIPVKWSMQYEDGLERARKTWHRLQEGSKKHGHELPDGDLLYVMDWD